MQRPCFLAVLSVFLSWIVSAQAQTVTEIKSNGPTVVVVFTSSNNGPASLTTITTLSGTFPTISKPSSPTSAASSTVLERPHVSSPVAMVAGSLSGFIAIFAAVLVIIVVRRRKSGKRNRRRTSIIRALEAQHPGSFGGNVRGTSPTDDDDVDFRGSDSGSFSDRVSSQARSPSGAGTTLRDSGRGGKNSSKKNRSRYPSSPTKATRNHRRSEDVELDWRDSNSLPSPSLDSERSPLPSSQPQRISAPTLNAAPKTTTINSTSSTSAETDAKLDSQFEDVYPPRLLPPPSQSPPTLIPEPSLAFHTASGRPPPNTIPQGDLPPAYEDVR